MRENRDVKPNVLGGLINIRRLGTKFSLSGDLAVGICAPLLISIKVPRCTKFCIIKCPNFN